MKKLILLLTIILTTSINTWSQTSFYGDDVLKYYTFGSGIGTSRVQGMGGGFSALGGDISNNFTNPAGLAFFNKNEFSITPIFISNQTSGNYIDNQNTTNSSSVSVGQLGAVFSNKGIGSRKKRSAWSINYANLVNFNNSYSYSGINKVSSIAEYYGESANNLNLTVPEIEKNFNETTLMAQSGVQMAYFGYLIDPIGDQFYIVEDALPITQSGKVVEKGNLSQINLSYASNFDDKTYIGGSLGIQNLNYSKNLNFDETFTNGILFKNFTIFDEYLSSGTGVNINLGIIHKLNETLRLGFAVQTPTFMKIRDTYSSSLDIYFKNKIVVPDYYVDKEKNINGGYTIGLVPNDFNYNILSPLKSNLGVSVILPKKIGAINIEAEYIGYSLMAVNRKSENEFNNYQKSEIQNNFKDVLNIKTGAELRSGVFRLRAGLAYLTAPHRDQTLYNSQNLLMGSLGFGIRNSKFFVDIAYSRAKTLSAFTPYTLDSLENYSSVSLNQSKGIVGISFGTFF